MSDPPLLNIHTYDNNSEATKNLSCNAATGESDLKTKTLGEIRKVLIKLKVLSSRLQRSPFCTKNGAEVHDTMVFATYLGLLDQKEIPKPENSATPSGEKYDIYFLQSPVKTEIDDTTKEFLKEKLNLALDNDKNTLDKPTVKNLMSSFLERDFRADSSSVEASEPADMTEKDWDIVLRNNSLLCGTRFSAAYISKESKKGTKSEVQPKGQDTETGVSSVKIDRAEYPAFSLKIRALGSHELSHNPDIQVKSEFRIPRFQVADNSYVDVFETKNDVSNMMAQSSFSQTDAEVSIGGGAFGFSAAAKSAFSKSDKEALAKASESGKDAMHISYNFPRVVLSLDIDSLEISKECKEDLGEMKDGYDLRRFHQKYGQFFPTRVVLGGRLYYSDETKAISGSETYDKARSLKVAASLSFSSPYVQGSASFSQSNSEKSQGEKKESNLSNAISWRAEGGETLLCNNPPAWCSTVGSYYNWRVVKQENFVTLHDLISGLPDMQDIAERFDKLAEGSPLYASKDPPEVKSVARFFLKYDNDVDDHDNKDSYLYSGDPNSASDILSDIGAKERSDPEGSHVKNGETPLIDKVGNCFSSDGGGVNVRPKGNDEKDKIVPFMVEVKSAPSNSWKLQYNEPYQILIPADKKWSILATPTQPGFYHKTVLFAYPANPSTDDNQELPKGTSILFSLRSADHTRKEGVIQHQDKVYLSIVADRLDNTERPRTRGTVTRLLHYCVGAEEWTGPIDSSPLPFTLEYAEKEQQ